MSQEEDVGGLGSLVRCWTWPGVGCGGCDLMGYRSLTFCFYTCGVYSGLGVREGMALPPSFPGKGL